MKFGMFDTIRWHKDWSDEKTIKTSLEQIELADSLGIEDIWLGEHHFSRHGILSGIFSYMGAVAAKTKQARIGTAIVVLPFHNPVQVAEESAIIDIISNICIIYCFEHLRFLRYNLNTYVSHLVNKHI